VRKSNALPGASWRRFCEDVVGGERHVWTPGPVEVGSPMIPPRSDANVTWPRLRYVPIEAAEPSSRGVLDFYQGRAVQHMALATNDIPRHRLQIAGRALTSHRPSLHTTPSLRPASARSTSPSKNWKNSASSRPRQRGLHAPDLHLAP